MASHLTVGWQMTGRLPLKLLQLAFHLLQSSPQVVNGGVISQLLPARLRPPFLSCDLQLCTLYYPSGEPLSLP